MQRWSSQVRELKCSGFPYSIHASLAIYLAIESLGELLVGLGSNFTALVRNILEFTAIALITVWALCDQLRVTLPPMLSVAASAARRETSGQQSSLSSTAGQTEDDSYTHFCLYFECIARSFASQQDLKSHCAQNHIYQPVSKTSSRELSAFCLFCTLSMPIVVERSKCPSGSADVASRFCGRCFLFIQSLAPWSSLECMKCRRTFTYSNRYFDWIATSTHPWAICAHCTGFDVVDSYVEDPHAQCGLCIVDRLHEQQSMRVFAEVTRQCLGLSTANDRAFQAESQRWLHRLAALRANGLLDPADHSTVSVLFSYYGWFDKDGDSLSEARHYMPAIMRRLRGTDSNPDFRQRLLTEQVAEHYAPAFDRHTLEAMIHAFDRRIPDAAARAQKNQSWRMIRSALDDANQRAIDSLTVERERLRVRSGAIGGDDEACAALECLGPGQEVGSAQAKATQPMSSAKRQRIDVRRTMIHTEACRQQYALQHSIEQAIYEQSRRTWSCAVPANPGADEVPKLIDRPRPVKRTPLKVQWAPEHSKSAGKSEQIWHSSCSICLEDFGAARCAAEPLTEQCTHADRICRDCSRQFISSRLDTTTWDNIACFNTECKAILKQADISKHASKADFDRYERFAMGAALGPDFVWCTAPSCRAGQYHVGEFDAPIFTCKACSYKYCLTHEMPWHEGVTCEQYDQQLDRMMKINRGMLHKSRKSIVKLRESFMPAWLRKKEESISSSTTVDEMLERAERRREELAGIKAVQKRAKPCPKCGWYIEKSTGCDHMTCRKCKHQFCWLCFAVWPKIRPNGRFHKKSCKLWSSH